MLGALLRGVSTREYQEVLPQMAETVGVSRSCGPQKQLRFENQHDTGNMRRC
jgi:hypothetical protein